MKKLIFITIILLWATGCSITHVTSLPKASPYPIVRETNMIGMSGMYIETSIIKLKIVKQGSEFFTLPIYYPNGSTIKIDDSTSMVYVVTRIKNSKNYYYSLWEIISPKQTDEGYPSKTEHMKYEYKNDGKIYHEFKFVIPLSEQTTETSYHIQLRDKGGITRAFIGQLTYTR